MGESHLREFMVGVQSPFALVVERLAAVLAASPQPLDSAIKWRQLTYAFEGDFHHWICSIAVTKRAVALTFHFGGLLDDPRGLFIAGSSRFLRKLEYRSAAEVDDAAVLGFVAQAIDRLDYFKDNWKAIQAGTLDV